MRFLCLLALLALLPESAQAAPHPASKLDPRLRITIAAFRSPAASALAQREDIVPVQTGGRVVVFVVGDASRAQLESAGARVRTMLPGVATASIAIDDLERVASIPSVRSLEGAAALELELDASVPATGVSLLRNAPPEFSGVNGTGVLVGIVDSGVDLLHPDFIDLDGHTRIVGIWDQTVSGVPPTGFDYGSSCTASDIDGLRCTQLDDAGHGTQVLGIAAGSGRHGGTPYTYVGMAPRADLAVVKCDLSTTGLVDAVRYLFDLAGSRGQPAVVNLSLGSPEGPHDGSSAVDQALNALTGPGRILVKSAGNHRGLDTHAEVSTATTDSVQVRVYKAQQGAAFAFEGYVSNSQDLEVAVSFRILSVTRIVTLGSGQSTEPWPGTWTPFGYVYVENGVSLTSRGDRRIYIEAQTAPGAPLSNGVWSFGVRPRVHSSPEPPPLGVDFWRIFTKGLSLCYFLQGGQPYEEQITEPGNGDSIVTVGAWVSRNSWTACNYMDSYFFTTPVGDIGEFSSPGPTRDGRMKPEVCAPGSAVISSLRATLFPLCPSAPSGSIYPQGDNFAHFADWGTSLSAPHVTGAIALLLQKRPSLGPAGVRAYLAAHSHRDDQTGPDPGNDWGFGKLWLDELDEPLVRVLEPNGGDVVSVLHTQTVRWEASDESSGVPVVDLELSRSGAGGPWETIASAVPNTGSWEWGPVPPASAPGGAFVRARAYDGNGNTAVDATDGGFTIDVAPAAVVERFSTREVEGLLEVGWRLRDPIEVVLERSDSPSGPWGVAIGERRAKDGGEIVIDTQVRIGRRYWYRLRDVVTPSTLGLISGQVERPVAAALGIAPNPARSRVRIEYTAPRPQAVMIDVVDILGRTVKVLVKGQVRIGRHFFDWEGATGPGSLAPGIYFVRYAALGRTSIARLAVVR